MTREEAIAIVVDIAREYIAHTCVKSYEVAQCQADAFSILTDKQWVVIDKGGGRFNISETAK